LHNVNKKKKSQLSAWFHYVFFRCASYMWICSIPCWRITFCILLLFFILILLSFYIVCIWTSLL